MMDGLRHAFWAGVMAGVTFITPLIQSEQPPEAAKAAEKPDFLWFKLIEPSRPFIDIVALYDWPLDEAVAVIDCENPQWDPEAVSATSDYGIMQHNWEYGPARFKLNGYDWYEDRFDPAINIEVGYWLWSQTRTWDHWTCRYVLEDGGADEDELVLPGVDMAGVRDETGVRR